MGWPRFPHTSLSAAVALVSHRWTVPSKLGAASWFPDGENATPYTWSAGPCKVAISTGRAGRATFQSQTVPSVTPTASIVPDGLNAAAHTYPDGPVSGLPSATAWAGSATFHRCTVLSALPTASVLLLGENASPMA